MERWLALAVLVAGCTALALTWRGRQGRPRAVPAGARLAAEELGVPLGRTATLVQFSAPACGPCRSTRRVLGEVTRSRHDVVHVDLDVGQRPDLAARHRVLSTPTVLVLDAVGTVRHRLVGAVDRRAAERLLQPAAEVAGA